MTLQELAAKWFVPFYIQETPENYAFLFCFSNRVACRPNENKILPFIGFIRFDQICELVENKREGLRTLVGKIARWNRVFTVYAFSMVSSRYARLVILSFFLSFAVFVHVRLGEVEDSIGDQVGRYKRHVCRLLCCLILG